STKLGLRKFTDKRLKRFILNSPRLKRYIFDSLFFTYSAALVAYFALLGTENFGGLKNLTSQDNAAQHMSLILWSLAGLTVLTMVLTFILEKFKISSLGDVLFAAPIRRREIGDRPFWKSFWGVHLGLTLALTVAASLIVTELSVFELTDPGGLHGALRLY